MRIFASVAALWLVSGVPAQAEPDIVPDAAAGIAAPQCIPPTSDALAAPQSPPAQPTGTISEAGPDWLGPSDPVEVAPPSNPGQPPLAPCLPPVVRPPAPDLFGFAATPIGVRSALEKWQGVERGSLENLAGPWDEMLDQARKLTGDDQLDMVNRWVNWHVRFEDDRGGDAWASAALTLQRGSGDCEDFAIAKMGLLARLGIPGDDMFLVLVRDRLRSLDHAVLAVKEHNSFRILDNRTDTLRHAEDIDDYLPTLGYSGAFAWIYGRRYAGANPAHTSGSMLP